MPEDREEIRNLIYRNSLSYRWLLAQLEVKGITIHDSTLSAILRGARHGSQAEQVISESLTILRDYERKMTESK